MVSERPGCQILLFHIFILTTALWRLICAMSIRREIEKRIEKKQAELAGLQKQIAEASAYIQAMHDVLKLHTKEGNGNSAPVHSLRDGTDLSKVRNMILKEGHPIHINEIIKGLGKEDTNSNRTSVAGSLGSYVRR